MIIGFDPKPIRNIHEQGPANARRIEVEEAKTEAVKLLVRRAMEAEDPERRIDLVARSRARNVHILRGHLLDARANDPDAPAIALRHSDAEELEMQAAEAIDAVLAEQNQEREPQLH